MRCETHSSKGSTGGLNGIPNSKLTFVSVYRHVDKLADAEKPTVEPRPRDVETYSEPTSASQFYMHRQKSKKEKEKLESEKDSEIERVITQSSGELLGNAFAGSLLDNNLVVDADSEVRQSSELILCIFRSPNSNISTGPDQTNPTLYPISVSESYINSVF